jgi:hypothetical protein
VVLLGNIRGVNDVSYFRYHNPFIRIAEKPLLNITEKGESLQCCGIRRAEINQQFTVIQVNIVLYSVIQYTRILHTNNNRLPVRQSYFVNTTANVQLAECRPKQRKAMYACNKMQFLKLQHVACNKQDAAKAVASIICFPLLWAAC